MATPFFDIFKNDLRGNSIWLDSVADLKAAQLRLAEFAAALPGEYFAFDQRTRTVVQFELDQIECT